MKKIILLWKKLMMIKPIAQPVGEDYLPPVPPKPHQDELCRRFEDLYSHYSLKSSPSKMFQGALFVSRSELKHNPDWISQAANSLREMLYPFWSDKVNSIPDKREKALKNYGSVKTSDQLIGKIANIWGKLNTLTHHSSSHKSQIDFSKFTESDFLKLLGEFEDVSLQLLSRQIDIHTEIDSLISQNPPEIQ